MLLGKIKEFFPRVQHIVDATRNAAIEVTNVDAASKAVKNHSACAMAVACKRKFNLDGVIISRTKAYLIKGNTARRFELPESVAREVVSFDRGSGFAPGQYALQKISPQNRLGARQSPSKDDATRDGKPKRFRHMTTNVRSVLGGMKAE